MIGPREPTTTSARPGGVQHVVRVALTFLGVIAVNAALLGCGGPTATGPLLTVELRGGHCNDGPCGTTVALDRDGRVHGATKPPNDLGTVPADQLRVLDRLIATTDYSIIRSRPFAGDCPTAFDGQEIVFSFAAPGGVQRIASCDVAIDYGLPLFVAVSTALGPFVPLPTT
jgi:hypothetical protein